MSTFELNETRTTLTTGSNILRTDTSSFVNACFGATTLNCGFLPPVVRWMSPNGQMIVFERPPSKQMIDYEGEMFDVAVPWSVYIIQLSSDGSLSSMHLFARKEPISSMDDELFAMPLPNVWSGGLVCMPEEYAPHPTISSAIKAHVATFWGSTFNREVSSWKLAIPKSWDLHGPADLVALEFLESHTAESILSVELIKPALLELCTLGTAIEALQDDRLESASAETVLRYVFAAAGGSYV